MLKSFFWGRRFCEVRRCRSSGAQCARCKPARSTSACAPLIPVAPNLRATQLQRRLFDLTSSPHNPTYILTALTHAILQLQLVKLPQTVLHRLTDKPLAPEQPPTGNTAHSSNLGKRSCRRADSAPQLNPGTRRIPGVFMMVSEKAKHAAGTGDCKAHRMRMQRRGHNHGTSACTLRKLHTMP